MKQKFSQKSSQCLKAIHVLIQGHTVQLCVANVTYLGRTISENTGVHQANKAILSVCVCSSSAACFYIAFICPCELCKESGRLS